MSIQDLHYEGEVEGPNGLFDFLHLYLGDFAPSLGSDASDVIELQIAEVDPAPSGQVDLGSGANTDLTSCTVCLLIGVDNTGSPGSYAHVFFQSAGVLDLGTSTSPRVSGSFSGVRLVEVVIDGAGHVTPISGGDCIDVVDENRDALAPVEWTCAESYFADDMGCDCGCGYPDTDCTDSTAGACQYCNEAGSCNTAACPGTIDPTDNSTCM